MNFPRFWAKGQAKDGHRVFESWGWSDSNAEEAKRRGDEAARRVAERFAATGRVDHRRYYFDRPFREEVLETVADENGLPAALITRNSYGCDVLNTARLMFVDVDIESESSRNPATGWLSWFGGRSVAPPPKNADVIIQRARDWADRHYGWGWRIYRTKAGLRLVATHQPFDPVAMANSELFDMLTTDPLYRRLCQNQKCFRARLTPKPWRCGFRALSVPWPWTHPNAEKRFRDWQKRYDKASAKYATCTLVETVGNREFDPNLAPIIRLHDARTRVGSGLSLA